MIRLKNRDVNLIDRFTFFQVHIRYVDGFEMTGN